MERERCVNEKYIVELEYEGRCFEQEQKYKYNLNIYTRNPAEARECACILLDCLTKRGDKEDES